jgi:hypothetical protein
MPKKPTGNIGPFVAKSGPAGVTGGWEKIKFPEDKESIEKFALELWCSEIKKAGGSVRKVAKNPEDHFDFTLELPGGKVYLDLVEFIYRDKEGRPYESDEIEIKVFDFAEQIHDTVLRKSQHYGKVGEVPIHLLLYVTHWRFWPPELVIRLAQHFLSEAPPIMENVFLVLPLDEKAGHARVLYPSRDPLEGHDPNEFKDTVCWILDPSKSECVSNIG